jgi:hypothetical protein
MSTDLFQHRAVNEHSVYKEQRPHDRARGEIQGGMNRVRCDWRFPRSLHTLYGYFVPIVDTIPGMSPVLRRILRWGRPTLSLGLAVPRTAIICDLGSSNDLASWLSERSGYISVLD